MPIRARILAPLALAAVVLTGCAPAVIVEEETVGASAATPTASTSAPSSSPTPSSSDASPTPSEQADAPGAVDTSGWLEHATHDGDLRYRYPADWILASDAVLFAPDADRTDVPDPYERWMDTATLARPDGQPLLQVTDVVDVGGACPPEDRYPIEVLASEPIDVATLDGTGDAAILTAAIATTDGRWRVGVGISSLALEPGTEGCAVDFVFATSDGPVAFGTHLQMAAVGDDPLWTVATLADARAYLDTTEHATMLEVLRSVETS